MSRSDDSEELFASAEFEPAIDQAVLKQHQLEQGSSPIRDDLGSP